MKKAEIDAIAIDARRERQISVFNLTWILASTYYPPKLLNKLWIKLECDGLKAPKSSVVVRSKRRWCEWYWILFRLAGLEHHFKKEGDHLKHCFIKVLYDEKGQKINKHKKRNDSDYIRLKDLKTCFRAIKTKHKIEFPLPALLFPNIPNEPSATPSEEPKDDSPEKPIKPEKNDYIFRNDGEKWTLNFPGLKNPLQMDHHKGFLYIQYALSQPFVSFNVTTLLDIFGNQSLKSNVSSQELSQEELNITTISTSHGTKKLNQALSIVKSQLNDVRQKGDNETLSKLLDKQRQLEEMIDSSPLINITNSRKAVWIAIVRAYEAIKISLECKKESLALYEHLKTFLPTKFPFKYQPDKEFCWIV
jgi:hypothetical protein